VAASGRISERGARPEVVRVVLAGAWTHEKSRALLAVFAIALGVALGYAVQLITAAAVNELAAGVALLSGDADLELRGPRGGFDENVFPEIAALPEVAAASPLLEVDATLPGRDKTLTILGVDVFRAATVQPQLVASVADRLATLRSDTVFLSPAAARWLDVEPGATLRVQVGLQDVALRVGGVVPAEPRQSLAVMDIAGAQAAFARLGRITRLDLRLRPGVDPDRFADGLAARLPAGVAIQRPQASIEASASASRAYRVNMMVLALVALFTGALLVFSTQSLSVVRRRPQFALLRVLGVTRRQLAWALLTEGALIGGVGSACGLLVGFALAQFAVRNIGVDLGSGYFRGVTPTIGISPVALGASFVLGVTVAVLASVVPARSAARAPPALALKAGDDERAFARHYLSWPGVVALAVALVAALAPPVAGLPLFGYFAIALLLGGCLMLLPALARLVLAALPTPRGAAPQLAVTQLRGTPGSAAVSLAAIVASASLMVSMAIMVHSFRDGLATWLARILPADAYVRVAAGGDTAFLTPEYQARLAALPGVRSVEFLHEQQVVLDASRPRVTLLARPIDAANPGARLPLLGAAVALGANAPPSIWVSEAMVDVYGFAPGRVVELPIDGRAVPFTVAGVWRDYARQQGTIVIDRARYIAITGDRTATNAALWLTPGTDLEQLRGAIAEAIPGGDRLELAAPGEIRELSLRIFDRTFAVTYALELAAVVIGLLGLSSSFGALVIARRREFGVLRHLGMTRRQVAAMLATEGLVVGAIGMILGLALGGAISVILIEVVNRQSFHWGMAFLVPWAVLTVFILLFLALATCTAVIAGRGAMSHEVVRSVRDDW
jgi:putative ABC transport system permease protein